MTSKRLLLAQKQVILRIDRTNLYDVGHVFAPVFCTADPFTPGFAFYQQKPVSASHEVLTTVNQLKLV